MRYLNAVTLTPLTGNLPMAQMTTVRQKMGRKARVFLKFKEVLETTCLQEAVFMLCFSTQAIACCSNAISPSPTSEN